MQTHYEFMRRLDKAYARDKIKKEYGVLLRILAMADLALLDFENNKNKANYKKMEECVNFLHIEDIVATNAGEDRLPPILEQRITAVKEKYIRLHSKTPWLATENMTDDELLASFIVFKNSQQGGLKNDDKRA